MPWFLPLVANPLVANPMGLGVVVVGAAVVAGIRYYFSRPGVDDIDLYNRILQREKKARKFIHYIVPRSERQWKVISVKPIRCAPIVRGNMFAENASVYWPLNVELKIQYYTGSRTENWKITEIKGNIRCFLTDKNTEIEFTCSNVGVTGGPDPQKSRLSELLKCGLSQKFNLPNNSP